MAEKCRGPVCLRYNVCASAVLLVHLSDFSVENLALPLDVHVPYYL